MSGAISQQWMIADDLGPTQFSPRLDAGKRPDGAACLNIFRAKCGTFADFSI